MTYISNLRRNFAELLVRAWVLIGSDDIVGNEYCSATVGCEVPLAELSLTNCTAAERRSGSAVELEDPTDVDGRVIEEATLTPLQGWT